VPVPGSAFLQCVLEASLSLPGIWTSVGNPITLPAGPFIIAQTNRVDAGARANSPKRFYRVRWIP